MSETIIQTNVANDSGLENFADLFALSMQDLDMKTGSIVTGTIIDIDS